MPQNEGLPASQRLSRRNSDGFASMRCSHCFGSVSDETACVAVTTDAAGEVRTDVLLGMLCQLLETASATAAARGSHAACTRSWHPLRSAGKLRLHGTKPAQRSSRGSQAQMETRRQRRDDSHRGRRHGCAPPQQKWQGALLMPTTLNDVLLSASRVRNARSASVPVRDCMRVFVNTYCTPPLTTELPGVQPSDQRTAKAGKDKRATGQGKWPAAGLQLDRGIRRKQAAKPEQQQRARARLSQMMMKAPPTWSPWR